MLDSGGKANLDSVIIGNIEKYIDFLFQRIYILDSIDWILIADEEVERLELESVGANAIKEDLALGFILGNIWQFGCDAITKPKEVKVFDKRMAKLEKGETIRPINYARFTRQVKPTPEEFDKLKTIVTLWIKPFREKIRKELAQKAI